MDRVNIDMAAGEFDALVASLYVLGAEGQAMIELLRERGVSYSDPGPDHASVQEILTH